MAACIKTSCHKEEFNRINSTNVGGAFIQKRVINRYSKTTKRRKKATKGILITALIILIIIALSYYGQNVGNVIINVDRQSYQEGLSLSIADPKVDDTGLTSRLATYPLQDAEESQFSEIPGNIADGNGSKNDSNGRFLAFTFHLMNAGKLTTSYSVQFIMDTATRRIDSVLRIMIITEFPGDEPREEVYAKAQEGGAHDGEPELIYGPLGPDNNDILGTTVPFPGTDDKGVYYAVNYLVRDLPAKEVVRYTVVMWMDGWDAQSNVALMGAAVRMSMEFKTTKSS